MRRRLTADYRWVVVAGWAVTGAVLGWLVVFSGTDTASTILFSLALVVFAAVFPFARSALTVTGIDRLAWAGRMLAFVGAAVAIAFPAELYQEIRMLLSRGEPVAAWFEGAIWYQVLTMPLVLIPALVSLRWPRAGGVLFLLDALFLTIDWVYRPFGVVFPEASTDVLTFVFFIFLPPFAAAALLLLGGGGAPPRIAARPMHA